MKKFPFSLYNTVMVHGDHNSTIKGEGEFFHYFYFISYDECRFSKTGTPDSGSKFGRNGARETKISRTAISLIAVSLCTQRNHLLNLVKLNQI